MDDPSLSAVHQTIESFSRAHYTWVQPILRALTRLGGGATPKEVKASIRQHEAAQLSDDQWAYVLKNGRIGWARLGLRQSGLIGGPHGRWELTELARRYADATASDAFEIDEELPTLAMAPSQATKSVQVTHRSGYEIPLLAVLADGINRKKDIRQAIRERLADKLLAGDFERLPQGAAVWTFRLAWCLSHLKRNGEAKNTGHGIWEITAAGRERLEVEGPAWRIEPHQQSRAKVVVTDAPASKVEAAAEPWAVATWRALRRRIAPDIFDALDQRLRPDLGPTPADTSNFVPRNVVLYGPPGTGKTHVARQIAAALCGDAPESDDDEPRWRIVQFHPSYAYEDFIQGMKPDLEKTELRYVLRDGPFVELCAQAEKEPDAFFVLVIDEINRGDPARIFGELMYALEYRGESVGLPLGGQLSVPPNLVVIGTMNSVDRSVALVDYALRRRFGFMRVAPSSEVVLSVRGAQPMAAPAAALLDRFNAWLCERLDQEHALGHSYFLNPALPLDDATVFERIWRLDVLPLLEEYFFGDSHSLDEAAKRWRAAVSEALAEADEVSAEEQEGE